MGIKLRPSSIFLVLVATTIAFPSVSKAQTTTSNYETNSDAMERAYFRHNPNFYDNRSLKRQLDSFLGAGSFSNTFPENEIARDGELVNGIYRDMLTQQATNDPYLRTPDLPNPYGTSILMSPRSNAERLKVGTEFRF
ncbi:hypothetical protein H6G41_04720 [Tolypothrix sp. FACHB-123]|uniref:hypothetical protein n=1 Tax=Tolypothrix sp. FACHB-123 TaxID=2692868 RepID=UPI001683906B|nr:hypothetical protein [Tolypothrix sp. FACHB-123]MBD2353929.1 hypothetical protein [Tolypothrix sp. FACHB-123]